MNDATQFFDTTAGGAAYEIERSLRFNSSDSAYLSRVFPSAGNRRTFTLSFWIKRTVLGTSNRRIFGIDGSGGNSQFSVMFASTNALYIYGNSTGTTIELTSTGVFRDASAWCHVVLAVDTTQATAANRFKAYVNGSSVAGSYTYPGQNDQLFWNNADTHYIGRYASGYYTDDYLADVHFIDGQALDPTSFGEFDTNGVWQPKEYTGDFTIGPVYSNNSSGGALYGGTSWAQAFNGSLSNGPFTYSSTSNTLTLPPEVTWSSQIRVYALRYGGIFEINGTDVSSGIGTSAAWHDLTSTLGSSGTLSTIEIGDVGTSYVKLSAVELDGQILIDSSGLNSFHLPFSDNSTAAALGTDTSGNSNTWTVNNISVAAGAGNDSLVDTPTNYGEDDGLGGSVRGNYCTMNPLDITSGIALANGNLNIDQTAGAGVVACATWGLSSGKWYWEVQCPTGINTMVGIADFNVFPTSSRGYSGSGLYYYQSTGGLYGNLAHSGNNQPYGAAFQNSGDIVGVALDMDNGNVNFYKNGVNQGVANTSSLLGKTITAALNNGGAVAANVINFGQRPFAYTAPTGFKALCTTNLPEPQTITTSGSYTGNGVADGPFVFLNGVPTAMTVNGNAVTFGTEADKLSNGFKIRTTNTTYNQNASTYNYSITSTGDPFKRARAQSNP